MLTWGQLAYEWEAVNEGSVSGNKPNQCPTGPGHDEKIPGQTTHLYTQVKVVLRASAHDAVEAVDGVWHAELGVVQRVDLFRVAEVSFSRDDVLGALWGFWLDNVGQDEVDIGCSLVLQQKSRELSSGSSRHVPTRPTHHTSEPSTSSGDEHDVLL